MIQVTKKDQETSSAFVRRFTQRVQASGILRDAKAKRFFKKSGNRNLRRKGAVEREVKRVKYRKLWKMGKDK